MKLFQTVLQMLPWTARKPQDSHLPVVMWHGMGDQYDSEFMSWAGSELAKYDIETFAIRLDENGRKDMQAGFVGDTMTQILEVCDQLSSIAEFADGFNAIGFSQGGLFLRSAIEICGLPVKTLITYGSPHNGVSDPPPCAEGNWICEKRNQIFKQHVYDEQVQASSIQAQYYRDMERYDTYLETSVFLKYANNELVKNETYAENLGSLDKFVMVLFDEEDMIVPAKSTWMWDLDQETLEPVPFDKTESYEYDLIGLRKLHKEGKLEFVTSEGVHMNVTSADLKLAAEKYL